MPYGSSLAASIRLALSSVRSATPISLSNCHSALARACVSGLLSACVSDRPKLAICSFERFTFVAIGSPVLKRDVAYFERKSSARSNMSLDRCSVSLISVTALAARSLARYPLYEWVRRLNILPKGPFGSAYVSRRPLPLCGGSVGPMYPIRFGPSPRGGGGGVGVVVV